MKGLQLVFVLFILLAMGYGTTEDYEMDDFEDNVWDILKSKTNTLLKKNNNVTVSNENHKNDTNITLHQTNTTALNKTNVTIANETKLENSTHINETNTTTTNATNATNVDNVVDQRFVTIVENVIEGYKNISKKTKEEVESKRQKMQSKQSKISKEITVMKRQIEELSAQIQDKIKEVEVSQDSINKQDTSLKVYFAQLKKNSNENDSKLRNIMDKKLRVTIRNARKQKKSSVKEQNRLISELRGLYRQKKAIQRDLKEREQEESAIAMKIEHLSEVTKTKVDEIDSVVAWMKSKMDARSGYIEKLREVRKSINETESLLGNILLLPSKRAQLKETVLQLKKVKLNAIRNIKSIRKMLAARIAVFDKTHIARVAYETKRDRLANEEKVLQNKYTQFSKKANHLRKIVKEEEAHMKKQTVTVLKEISASKLTELRGNLDSLDIEVRKIQRKLSFVRKQLIRTKEVYNKDLEVIQEEFQRTKLAAFKKAKKVALQERRRLERRIERLERAMTDKKYTSEQTKLFAEKAALLRKNLPGATATVDKAVKRLQDEFNKTKKKNQQKYEHLKEISQHLKDVANDIAGEVDVLHQKIARCSTALEKSSLQEDLNDAQKRYSAAQVKSQKAAQEVSEMETSIIEQLDSDSRAERKMVHVLTKSKKRTLKRITVLKDRPEYSDVVEELQRRVEEVSQQIEAHEKKANDLEEQMNDAIKRRDEDIKMAVVEAQTSLSKLRSRKEEIAQSISGIMRTTKSDGVKQLKGNSKKMLQLKKELLVMNKEEKKTRETLEHLNEVIFTRSLDAKTKQAARQSKALIHKMKKSSRKVRKLRSRLANNKRIIEKLYKSVHETGDVLSERAEEKMEQLKNIRALLKNKLRGIMYEHKKLQSALLKHVERVKRLSKYRLHHFHKDHSALLKQRNSLLVHKKQIKQSKGTEYFYTQLDSVDEKMNDVLHAENIYKQRLNHRIHKMIAIAKECEKKTPTGLEGIRVKCTLCRNLSAFLLKKLRRDRMSPKQAMKEMYAHCETSTNPAQCLRTALKLSTKAFLPQNKDLTPKELCYAVGRCVLNV
ncbi:Saposin B-type domain-containing protein [Entamoeba marina]